jgi:hypothetical protein
MAKKQCSKGHIYDSAIYGDNCPFCPSQGSGTIVNSGGGNTGDFGGGGETEVNPDGRTFVGGDSPTISPTVPMDGGRTVIRPRGQEGDAQTNLPSGRKVVGLLATYDTISTGQIFNVFEGKNFIGRDASADISIQGDSQISGKHLSILYRTVDGRFKFKDEQSSNGTFINEALTDEGELNTFDVIRIGSTRLIFVAIPQLPKPNSTREP